MPKDYTWRRRLNAKEVIDCADGRKSMFTPKVSDADSQTFRHELKPALRDSLEFTVPGIDRTFVWLCSVSTEACQRTRKCPRISPSHHHCHAGHHAKQKSLKMGSIDLCPT